MVEPTLEGIVIALEQVRAELLSIKKTLAKERMKPARNLDSPSGPAMNQNARPNSNPDKLNDLTNWISLAECAARLPSPQQGKRTKSATVLRLARKHGLTVLRRGQWAFVYWPDVLELFKPERVTQPRPPRFPNGARRTLAQAEATRKKLEELGVA